MTDRTARVSARVLLATAVVWAVCALSLAVAESADPLAAAQTLYNERKYEDARTEAEKLLGGEAPRDATLLVANCNRALKDYDAAIGRYRDLIEEDPDDSVALNALIGLSDTLQRQGKFDESEDALDRATRLYPEVTDAQLAAEGASLYRRNRAHYESAVDFVRGQLDTLAGRYEAADDTTGALLTYRTLYRAYPDHRNAPELALKLGDMLEGEAAAAYYLRALDSGYDRCFSTEAKLSVNQRYLDVVAKPPDAERIQTALAGINACTGETLSEDELAAFADGWREALAQTYEPFSDHGRNMWAELATEEPWSTLCSLAVAKSHMRDGQYRRAIDVLQQIPQRPTFEVLRQRRFMRLAEAYIGLNQFDEAREHAHVALVGPDRILTGQAHLLIGRAAEMAMDFDAAARAYRVASIECPAEWDRQQADYALKRVTQLQAPPASQPRVAVLPDDRTTRGDWPLGYGRQHYILCAQNFVLDRTGGLGPKLGYSYGTTSDDEPGRRWVTKKSDDDPVALWDPALLTHKPANWDDHGEQNPVGSGPDVVVALDVPRGPHVLSLYFVNDYNYYEPNRYYTISVMENGELQAVTDVEHFGGGVYKRFVVQGPVNLDLRIWRNLSINTLLSGVFLDPLSRMQPSPPVGVAYQHPQAEALAKRCRTIDGRILSKPLSMPDQIASLDRLIDDLGNESPELSWMRSEALRVRGHFREAEAGFDAYLAAIPDHCAPDERADVHARIAEELTERDEQELLRRRVFKHGTHRWDRAYAAHIAALEDRHDDGELIEALTAFAREHDDYLTAFAAAMAFDRIAELSPEAVDGPELLLMRVHALEAANRHDTANAVLQDILDRDMSQQTMCDALLLQLRLEARSGNVDAAQLAYEAVLGNPKLRDDQERNALKWLLMAHINGGDIADAAAWARDYEQRHGTTAMSRWVLSRTGG